MYFKKILLAIVVIGLIVCAWFANFVYQVMLTPNTNFQNQEAFIWISEDDGYQEVKEQLEPLLEDIEAFDVLAKQKQYNKFVKPGRYRIKIGMTNNDIINSIRSNNIPVILSFNNQNS